MGVLDNGREWTCSVDVYDLNFGDPTQDDSIQAIQTATYTGTNIKSWKITDTMSANGDVAFGSTGSKALNLELFGLASKTFGTGAIIGVTLTLVGGSSSSWYFFVDTVAWNVEYGTTTKYTASVTAYDAMYYASGKISNIADVSSTPATIKTVIQNKSGTITECQPVAQYCIRHARYDLIRTRAAELSTTTGDIYDIYANMFDNTYCEGYTSGKTMDNVCDDSTGRIIISAINGSETITITNGMTGRTLLSRMAALKGKRALCSGYSLSTVGTIDFDDLIGTTYTGITKADVYDNGFVSEGSKRFQYFTNGKVSYGKQTSNGFSTMAIDCPDMNNSTISSLGSTYKGTSYEIGSVKFRGDPALKAGRRMNAPDSTGTTHSIVATKVVSNFDGGFYQQIYSEGKSDSDIQFEANSATEKAEEVVDEGGGGGGTPINLLYYSETTSPDSATIAVSGNSIVTDADGIIVTGNIFADSIGNKSTSTTDGAKIMFGDAGGNNSTHLSTIIPAYNNSSTSYENTTLDWANADKFVTHNGGQTQNYYNELFIDKLDVGIDKGGNLSDISGQSGGIKSVGDVQIGGTFGIYSTTANLSVTGDTTLTGDIYLPNNITNIHGDYLNLTATTKFDITGTTEITGDFKITNHYSASNSNGIDINDNGAYMYNYMGALGIDNTSIIWATPDIILTYAPLFSTPTSGVFIGHNASLLLFSDIDSGTTFYIDFLSGTTYFG